MKKKLKIDKINLKENIIIFLIMALLLTVSLLSLYPGIITIDGSNQWKQVESNNIQTNHPFFSTFFWWLLAKLWHSPTVLVVFQIILLSIIWTFICSQLNSKGTIKRKIVYTIIMCFLPIIFAYAVSTWKDVIYSYMLLLLALMFYIGVKKDFKYTFLDIFIICISIVWVMSYRYNGIIAGVLSILTFFIIFLKKKIGWKKIGISFIILITIFGVCKLPEKIMYKPNESESTGTGTVNDIILFTLASLVKEDKIDDPNDLAIIDSIYPIEKMKEEYDPYVANSTSFSENYNREAYAPKTDEVTKILIKYAFKHPMTIIRHYLKVDNLLIGPTLKDGYVYIYEFSYWETKYSGNFDDIVYPIWQTGYKIYLALINFSTTTAVSEYFHMPANMMYLSIILMIIYCKKFKDKRYFLVLLPMLYNTISLLPINVAQDLRYVYINYLTLLLLVIPMFLFTKSKANNIQGNKYNNSIVNNKNNFKTLVIIPAYNEEDSIEKVVNSVYDENIDNCDVLVVNDGSKDKTEQKVKNTKAILIDSPNNLGIGGAVQTGYLYAKKNNYDIAIQIDGDGQHNPKYISKLIDEIKEGNDLVIGSRFIGEKDYKQTKLRMLGINLISSTINFMTDTKIYDTTSGLRAVNRNIIEEFADSYPYDYPEPITNMEIIKKGYKVKEIPVKMRQRETGKSSISPLKSISYMFKVIVSIIIMGFKN